MFQTRRNILVGLRIFFALTRSKAQFRGMLLIRWKILFANLETFQVVWIVTNIRYDFKTCFLTCYYFSFTIIVLNYQSWLFNFQPSLYHHLNYYFIALLILNSHLVMVSKLLHLVFPYTIWLLTIDVGGKQQVLGRHREHEKRQEAELENSCTSFRHKRKRHQCVSQCVAFGWL